MDRINNIKAITKKQCQTKQKEAKEMTDGKIPSGEQFPYKKQFDKLPAALDELQVHMDELQGQIDCMTAGSENILHEYEARKIEIEQLQNSIRNFDQSSADFERKMNEIHEKWYSDVMETVNVINTNFTAFMSAMDFAGEVELIRNNEVNLKVGLLEHNRPELRTLLNDLIALICFSEIMMNMVFRFVLNLETMKNYNL